MMPDLINGRKYKLLVSQLPIDLPPPFITVEQHINLGSVSKGKINIAFTTPKLDVVTTLIWNLIDACRKNEMALQVMGIDTTKGIVSGKAMGPVYQIEPRPGIPELLLPFVKHSRKDPVQIEKRRKNNRKKNKRRK